MRTLSVQVVAAGANPIQITRGIEKTTKALVSELKLMSKEVDLGFILRAFMKLNCKCLLIFFPSAIFRFYAEHS